MVLRFIKLSRTALFAWFGAALIASAATSGAQAAGPFAGYAGSWSGAGAISLTSGSVERMRCTAAYRVDAGGSTLVQNLNCASDSYKVDLQNQIDASGNDISGRWVETTRGAEGTITGHLGGGRIDGAVTGPGFTATFVLRERGNRPQIAIKVQGGDITEISADLARSR
jgi:hypothetical protein